MYWRGIKCAPNNGTPAQKTTLHTVIHQEVWRVLLGSSSSGATPRSHVTDPIWSSQRGLGCPDHPWRRCPYSPQRPARASAVSREWNPRDLWRLSEQIEQWLVGLKFCNSFMEHVGQKRTLARRCHPFREPVQLLSFQGIRADRARRDPDRCNLWNRSSKQRDCKLHRSFKIFLFRISFPLLHMLGRCKNRLFLGILFQRCDTCNPKTLHTAMPMQQTQLPKSFFWFPKALKQMIWSDAVDGRNPAPVDMDNPPVFIDAERWCRISSINSSPCSVTICGGSSKTWCQVSLCIFETSGAQGWWRRGWRWWRPWKFWRPPADLESSIIGQPHRFPNLQLSVDFFPAWTISFHRLVGGSQTESPVTTLM